MRTFFNDELSLILLLQYGGSLNLSTLLALSLTNLFLNSMARRYFFPTNMIQPTCEQRLSRARRVCRFIARVPLKNPNRAATHHPYRPRCYYRIPTSPDPCRFNTDIIEVEVLAAIDPFNCVLKKANAARRAMLYQRFSEVLQLSGYNIEELNAQFMGPAEKYGALGPPVTLSLAFATAFRNLRVLHVSNAHFRTCVDTRLLRGLPSCLEKLELSAFSIAVQCECIFSSADVTENCIALEIYTLCHRLLRLRSLAVYDWTLDSFRPERAVQYSTDLFRSLPRHLTYLAINVPLFRDTSLREWDLENMDAGQYSNDRAFLDPLASRNITLHLPWPTFLAYQPTASDNLICNHLPNVTITTTRRFHSREWFLSDHS